MFAELSPLFIYTFIGMVAPACGIMLVVLYDRLWTLAACIVLSLVGIVLSLGNPSTTVGDLIVSAGASVVAALLVFLFVLSVALHGLIEAPRAITVALRLGLVEEI